MVDLVSSSIFKQEGFDEKKLDEDPTTVGMDVDWIQEAQDAIFSKGQSKRIWNELYKV